jgi:hypothetical protein
MGKHNRSEMVAVQGSPCAPTPRILTGLPRHKKDKRDAGSLEKAYSNIQKLSFTPRHIGHCCTNVILSPFLHERDPRSLLRSNEFQMEPPGPLLSNNDPRPYYLPIPVRRRRQTDRQTDKHRQAPKVYSLMLRARRTQQQQAVGTRFYPGCNVPWVHHPTTLFIRCLGL